PAHVANEGIAARVNYMFGAKRSHKIAFFGCACGCDDPRAAPARDLKRGESNPASTAMHKEPLPGFQLGTIDQAVIGRKERNREGTGRLEGQPGWNFADQFAAHGTIISKPPAGNCNNGIAGLEICNLASARNDLASAFKPKGRACKPALEHFVGQDRKP